MLFDDHTAAQTYELYGPQNYSTAEISEIVDREIYQKRRHINVPKRLLKPAAGLLNRLLWWDVMSADEIEREFQDQVIDPSAKTFKDLGMEPSEISKWTYHYLVCIHSPGAFALELTDPPNSKDSVPRHTSICRRRPRRRCGRRRSTSTCSTTSKWVWLARWGWQAGHHVECTYGISKALFPCITGPRNE